MIERIECGAQVFIAAIAGVRGVRAVAERLVGRPIVKAERELNFTID